MVQNAPTPPHPMLALGANGGRHAYFKKLGLSGKGWHEISWFIIMFLPKMPCWGHAPFSDIPMSVKEAGSLKICSVS